MNHILKISLAAAAAVILTASCEKHMGTTTYNTLTFEGSKWDALIDSPQYGGPLLYGDMVSGVDYSWVDEGNTFLASELCETGGVAIYWNGGHAISNYVGQEPTTDYTLQLAIPLESGHDGSKNFCVHNGFTSEYSSVTGYFYFADGENINRTITYEPEVSWNYELGTHLNLFGGKLHADAAVYYTHISNQQLSVMAGNYGFGRMMVNAGKSGSCGLELALRGKAADDRLAWSATYSFTHSTFRQYADSVKADGGEGNVLRDYKGNHVPFVPKHTFSVVADYSFLFHNSGVVKSLTLGADVAGNGETYWDVDNEYSQKFYALLGMHVALDFGAIQVNVWGRNLTDTKYNTFLINSSVDRVQRSFAQRGTPIQVGVDFSLHL